MNTQILNKIRKSSPTVYEKNYTAWHVALIPGM